MSTVMKTTRDVEGHRPVDSAPGRAREGHGPGPVRRRHQARAACCTPSSCAARTRTPDHAHRREQGAGAAGRPRGADRGRHPRAEAEGADARPRHPRDRPRGVRGPAGRGRRRRRARDRRGSARPDRGRVRGAAGRGRPARVDEPGAPPVADAGTEADTSEALAHSARRRWRRARQADEGRRTCPRPRTCKRGDVAKGFAESDVVLENTYRVPDGPPGLPRAARGARRVGHASGNLTLWASTQGSFNTRSEVADVLGIAENRIKVIPVECGGGFGGKIRALCEPITALLARATGRPGALRDDPARGARGGHAGAAGHHPPQDRRRSGRHARWRSRRRPSSRPARSPAPCSR